MVCKKCGRYTDLYDWPERDQAFFTGDLCYPCFLESRDEKPTEPIQEESDADDDDVTIDEPDNDPELDDAPDIEAYSAETEELDLTTKPQQFIIPKEEGADAIEYPPHSFTDPNESIENTKRLLFG